MQIPTLTCRFYLCPPQTHSFSTQKTGKLNILRSVFTFLMSNPLKIQYASQTYLAHMSLIKVTYKAPNVEKRPKIVILGLSGGRIYSRGWYSSKTAANHDLPVWDLLEGYLGTQFSDPPRHMRLHASSRTKNCKKSLPRVKNQSKNDPKNQKKRKETVNKSKNQSCYSSSGTRYHRSIRTEFEN